jgi:hypothetical protein
LLPAIARLLLSVGAEVDAPGSLFGGRTALEAAAENGRIDMIHLLVNEGAQLDGVGNSQLERAKKLAIDNGYHSARGLLKSLKSEHTSPLDLDPGSYGMALSSELLGTDDPQGQLSGHDFEDASLSNMGYSGNDMPWEDGEEPLGTPRFASTSSNLYSRGPRQDPNRQSYHSPDCFQCFECRLKGHSC